MNQNLFCICLFVVDMLLWKDWKLHFWTVFVAFDILPSHSTTMQHQVLNNLVQETNWISNIPQSAVVQDGIVQNSILICLPP